MTSAQSDPPAQPAPGSQRGVLFVVFTTILIDFAGFSILIPVLPVYAGRLGASAFEVALIVTIYALAQLLFLPAWGWLSDRFGRRPVLLVSLAGTVAAYALLALSSSLMGLYLARALAGFFAAAIGTAQAVVTDVTAAEDRAKGMGRIGAAIGVAFAIGPALGGLLGAFDERLPFVAVAIVAGINLIVAWFMLPETRPDFGDPAPWRDLLRTLIPAPVRLLGAVHDRRIGLYLFLFFQVTTSFAVLESLLPKFLEDRFQPGTGEIGLLFASLGVFMIITQGFLLGRLAGRLGESTLVISGLVTCAVGITAIAWVPSMNGLYWLTPLVALGWGVAYPTFTSLYSQACKAREAGELLGQSQSMSTTGRVIGPMGAGLVMDHYADELTFVIAGAVLLAAMVIFVAFRPVLLGASR